MKVDNEVLNKLEKLSNIEITDDKKGMMVENLSEIVSFVENLNELDLESKDASFATIDSGTPFREDVPSQNGDVIDIILKNAPMAEENFFIVPKIIE